MLWMRPKKRKKTLLAMLEMSLPPAIFSGWSWVKFLIIVQALASNYKLKHVLEQIFFFFFFPLSLSFRPAFKTYESSQTRSLILAWSLTHWAGPGIKHTTSWILVRFVTTKPQWELQNKTFLKFFNFFFNSLIAVFCLFVCFNRNLLFWN